MTKPQKIAKLLTRQKKTLAIAESCTGGLLGKLLTDISGSSVYFKLGVIAYSYEAKTAVLNVPSAMIKKHGAVSEPVAMTLAQKVREVAQANFGIGITGIAGPTGGTKTKPVGLVYIAVSTPKISTCIKCLFKGNRLSVRCQAATRAMDLLLKFLN